MERYNVDGAEAVETLIRLTVAVVPVVLDVSFKARCGGGRCLAQRHARLRLAAHYTQSLAPSTRLTYATPRLQYWVYKSLRKLSPGTQIILSEARGGGKLRACPC